MVVGNGEKLAQAVDCGLAGSWGGLDRTSPSTATGRLDGQIGVSKFRLSELCLSLATQLALVPGLAPLRQHPPSAKNSFGLIFVCPTVHAFVPI